MCGIFNLVNKHNWSLQGRMTTLFKSEDKVAASKPNWNDGGNKWTLGFLTDVRDFERGWARAFFSQLVRDHLSPLSEEFEHSFPTTKTPELGRNRSATHLWTSKVNLLSMLEEDLLLEMADGSGLKGMFETTANLHMFWIKVKMEHPEVATNALKSPLPLPTSHLCEAGFSAATATKMRSWSRLDIGTHLGCHCLPSPPDGTV